MPSCQRAKLEGGEQIVSLEVWIILENRLNAHAGSEELKKVLDRVAQPANDRLPVADALVRRYSLESRHAPSVADTPDDACDDLFMTGSSTDLSPTREAVRQRLAGQWRESVSVVGFARGAITYYVSGRSRSGKQLHRNRLIRCLQYVVVGIYAVLALPVVVVLGVLDDLGIQVPQRARKSGRAVVKGAEASEPVRLADALRTAEKSLWVCWSQSHVALVGAAEDGQPRILWYAAGPSRPKIKPLDASLTWPDGATLELSISDQERDHIRQSNGRP